MESEKRHRVGIVGAGMAGLYAAHMLQVQQIHSDIKTDVELYELTDQPGGRVNTYHFTPGPDQYYETGAMRIPQTEMHQPVMDLIDYLNKFHNAELKVIDYRLTDPGNFVYVNGSRGPRTSSEQTAGALGFDVPDEYKDMTANRLLYDVTMKFMGDFHPDFEAGWERILQFDKFSFRSYLETIEGWDPRIVTFVETMTSQTNQYSLSFPELIMQNLDFSERNWKTLEGGMDTLPKALAKAVGLSNITFGARVQEIEEVEEEENGKIIKRVRIQADIAEGSVEKSYDKVILAIPPSAIRMIPKRPRWSAEKEEAIRSMYFEPLYKMGLQFETRFWEKVGNPCYGGQSTTDLPIRWIVYPSYGIRKDEPGVLLLYSWMWDASVWSSVPFEQRVKCALQHLDDIYKDEGFSVKKQFIKAHDLPWAEHNPTGDCMFLPNQFTRYLKTANENEGNIYFAGEHLSRHHTWITGALDSGKAAANAIFKDLYPPS